jgi:hypothetical protein
LRLAALALCAFLSVHRLGDGGLVRLSLGGGCVVLKSLPRKVLNDVRQKSHFFKNSLKYLLTNKYVNCIVRLMNDPLRPCRTGRSEWKGSPESFRGSAQLIFLPSFPWAGLPRRSPESLRGEGGSKLPVNRMQRLYNQHLAPSVNRIEEKI